MKPAGPPDDDGHIDQLRGHITTDLKVLRQMWDRRAQWTQRAAEDWTTQATRLRGVPAWAIGAVAGMLAGVWSALRRPRRVQ
jgi:hypothetical protein